VVIADDMFTNFNFHNFLREESLVRLYIAFNFCNNCG
jgi:hypothetical protein